MPPDWAGAGVVESISASVGSIVSVSVVITEAVGMIVPALDGETGVMADCPELVALRVESASMV